MIAGVNACLEHTIQASRDQILRCIDRRTNQDFDAFGDEQLLCALAHAAGDDPIDAALGKPRGSQSRLMRRRINVLALLDRLADRISIDQRETGTVAEMNGQLSVG